MLFGPQLQILSTNAFDCSPSLSLSIIRLKTESDISEDAYIERKYLFNAGESTQRYFCETRTKLTHLEHIFLTQLNISTFLGLFGIIASLSDLGAEKLVIHGPPGLAAIMNSSTNFLSRTNPSVLINEVDINRGRYCLMQDDYVQVFLLLTISDPFPRLSYACRFKPTISIISSKSSAISQNPLCHLAVSDSRRSFDDDVTSIQQLESACQQAIEQRKSNNMKPTDSSFDFPLFQFCFNSLSANRFETCIHLIDGNRHHSSQSYQFPPSFRSSAYQLLFNHARLPHLFPISTALKSSMSPTRHHHHHCNNSANSFIGVSKMMLRFSYNALLLICMNELVELNAINMDLIYHDQTEHLEDKLAKLHIESTCIDTQEEDNLLPFMLFLGTGSAKPSKNRNNSSILMVNQITNNDNSTSKIVLFFDMGEGTVSQLTKSLNVSVLIELLSSSGNEVVIWISHKHIDHHIGIISFISFISKLGIDCCLKIYAPDAVVDFLIACLHVIGISTPWLTLINHSSMNSVTNTMYWSFSRVLVKHCYPSYAIIATCKATGCTVAYSGDCRPSIEFQQVLSQVNVSVIIHEATFEQDCQEDAERKRHSTVTEAIEIADRAWSNENNRSRKLLILTHFSQRYPLLPPSHELTSSFGTVAACDNMMIHLPEGGTDWHQLAENVLQMMNAYRDVTNQESEVVETCELN